MVFVPIHGCQCCLSAQQMAQNNSNNNCDAEPLGDVFIYYYYMDLLLNE